MDAHFRSLTPVRNPLPHVTLHLFHFIFSHLFLHFGVHFFKLQLRLYLRVLVHVFPPDCVRVPVLFPRPQPLLLLHLLQFSFPHWQQRSRLHHPRYFRVFVHPFPPVCVLVPVLLPPPHDLEHLVQLMGDHLQSKLATKMLLNDIAHYIDTFSLSRFNLE